MEQRISMVTLGVADVECGRRFYEQLGWRGQTVQKTVFLQAGGMALVLWGREELARDTGVPAADTGGFGGVALAQNVRSQAEVDEVVTLAMRAGATVTRPPAETAYGGYAGYFADLDGHVLGDRLQPRLRAGRRRRHHDHQLQRRLASKPHV